MIPLNMVPVGETNRIQKITGRDEVRQRLAELGFVVGETVTLVSHRGGNMILSVKDSRVAIGQSCTIARLHGEGALKRRIMDMGLTRGTEVYVRKVAPLGDPVELTVRGYELTVRKGDAEMIEVE